MAKEKVVLVKKASMPERVRDFISGYDIYDYSGSSKSKTYFVDRGEKGYFLKIEAKRALVQAYKTGRFLYKKKMAGRIVDYISDYQDYLITENLGGQPGHSEECRSNPKKLAESFGIALRSLHELDTTGLDIPNLAKEKLDRTRQSFADRRINEAVGAYTGADDVDIAYIELNGYKSLIVSDVLVHGDYCLPNVLLEDYWLRGFVDLKDSGFYDRHYDLFWGCWSLWHNLKTDAYRDYFLGAYGRGLIDEDRLYAMGLIAALE